MVQFFQYWWKWRSLKVFARKRVKQNGARLSRSGGLSYYNEVFREIPHYLFVCFFLLLLLFVCMLFYLYLFISVILVDCICSINLFLGKKKKKFNTRIYWNGILTVSDHFHMFTQAIKFFTFYCDKLKGTNVWKRWFIK